MKYLISISKINKIGPSTLGRLFKYFKSGEAIWTASYNDLKHVGLYENIIQEFLLKRKIINPDQELENLNKHNIKVTALPDDDYPRLLKEIHNPPFILYYKGNLTNLSEESIAIVGSRKMTSYGKQITQTIVSELSNQNIMTISGLALGVDSIVHIHTLQNDNRTVAVLGAGLDRIYPTTNHILAQKIVEQNGLLISEYPIGTLPLKHNFPMRNRIISGLSLGTLVIEAGESSGALITAKFALEHNREVFAIPGNLTSPMSKGTNDLIKNGAKLVQSAEDILEELNIKQIQQFKTNQEIIPDSPEEAEILKHLTSEQKHVNELVKLSSFTITKVNSTLMMLEMKGLIKNLGNNIYIKSMN
jgi:DNA processing protein